MSTSNTIHLPPIRELAFGAIPRLIEGVLIPTALFLLLFNIFGVGAATDPGPTSPSASVWPRNGSRPPVSVR